VSYVVVLSFSMAIAKFVRLGHFVLHIVLLYDDLCRALASHLTIHKKYSIAHYVVSPLSVFFIGQSFECLAFV